MSASSPRLVTLICAPLAVVLALWGVSCAKVPEGSVPPGSTAGQSGGQLRLATLSAEDKVKLGEHLAVVSGCHDCHTPGTLYGGPNFSRTMAGSELGWSGPWGTTYARNLTPDVETGIGSWSEDDIVKALRQGQKPDGSPVLPPMPWPNFARFTDEEAYAVAAYLKSLPAVSHKVPDVVPPGQAVAGAVLRMPPPPAWDAPVAPPPGAATQPGEGHERAGGPTAGPGEGASGGSH